METSFLIMMAAVVLTLLGQTVAIGIWIGRTGEKVSNLTKRQDAMDCELEVVKKEQGTLGKAISRLQGLFNGRHEKKA